MEQQVVQATKSGAYKRRPGALKLLLVAGLSVQVTGVLMGLSLIILNLTH
jgi:hypothetical protein